MLNSLKIALEKTPLIYIARDYERAMALQGTKGYYIITNSTPLSTRHIKSEKDGLVIDEGRVLDTLELLEHKKTKKFLSAFAHPQLVVFKNTPQIETVCTQNNWKLINPPAALGSEVEEKLSQLKWLGELSRFLPPHTVVHGKELVWKNEPFIVQFNRAHTGTGTTLITSAAAVKALQTKFPERQLRVTKYISGPSFTNNNVVWDGHVLVGNINYQITGLIPFTENPFATIGNDWKLPTEILTPKQKKKYVEIAEAIGNKLITSGWKGLFGIDMLVDDVTGLLYLIEINARQPASTTYESYLQSHAAGDVVTTFEAHLAALLGLPHTTEKLGTITTGAQIIKRITEKGETIPKNKITELTKLGLNTISYTNTEPGSDLLRMQTTKNLMQMHNTLNTLGKKIQKLFE